MLLKSTFTPQFFAAIPAKALLPRLSRLGFINSLTQQRPETVRQNAPSPLLLHKLPPTSAYVHLPFCRKRCHYCDFPIIALGSSSTTKTGDDPRISSYVETLCREIKATKLDSSDNPFLETVFFGGGTPSLVPPRLVISVLEALSSKFGVCDGAEISIEMDPGTFDETKMKELMDLGVNRVSLGVQAFQEELLKACGRAHGLNEVYEAVEIIKSCGVDNWSLDLISSLPLQTPEMWNQSLQLTVQAQPTHVSVYDLQVEKDTKFGMLFTPGEFPLPSEDLSAWYYKMASSMLRAAGYDHYEISSYCKSGYRCKHNCTYWKNKSFYGFGLGSASHVGGIRFSRPRSLKEYTHYVQNLEDGLVKCSGNENIDAKETAMDIIMLSLRTSDGLNLKSFRDAFGGSLVLSICEAYKRYVESGHVICVDNRGREIAYHEFSSLLTNDQWRNEELAFVRLSDPEGFLLSNELISVAFGAVTP